ncbi:GntR family transcriptional regulator [Nonomuraea lactucae]|uniref:GntR family transcriptional regulator n=1 Tax=Nonomuraea lactucae TaxID=2249762 RepID=UPI0013B3C42D|nr:GntR family transcriptional regulator [Nonomuraea lactucae]
MSVIDRQSPVPVYFQIAGDIERKIEMEAWQPGEKLPSEIALAELYGVTRMTVRQALAQLAKDDLIELRRGRGAFVIGRKMPVVWDMNLTSGSYDVNIKSRGFQISSDVLSAVTDDRPSERISDALGRRGPVSAVVRRVYINGAPAAIYRSWFLASLVPGIEDAKGLDGPMKRFLADGYGLEAVKSENTIEFVRATPTEAAQLGIRVDSGLALVTGTSFTAENMPLEHFQVLWIGDRVRFHVTSVG